MKRRLLSAFLSLALLVAYVPATALAEEPHADDQDAQDAQDWEDADEPSSWADDIDALLGEGDYEEGEAVVIAAPDVDAEPGQELGELAGAIVTETFSTDGDTYEKALGETLPTSALEGAQDGSETVSSEDVEVRCYLLVDHSLTTRQILESLAKDPRVLTASPNYSYASDEGELPLDDGAEQDGEDEQGEEAGRGMTGQDAATEQDGEDEALLAIAPQDAGTATQAASSFVPNATSDATASVNGTSLQWAYNGGTGAFRGSFNALNIVSDQTWNTGAANSTGIVAVFDTGVDYTHPDLAASMANMSAYKSVVGGTSHGYNAINESAEPLDDNGHGTHVAGIIAAATNGYGVSGVANGVRLLPVKVGNSRGSFTSANIQRGYDYLKRVAKAGVDLRVVNNSWSGRFKDPAVSLAVTELGDLGVLSVFASGNNALTVDGGKFTVASLENNQYAVVVDSLNMDGTASAFTNRGKDCTDVFAPGGSIISTTKTSSRGTYMPSVMRSSSSTYVTFSGSSSLSATDEKGQRLGGVDASHGFDSEGGCLLVSGRELSGARSAAADSAAKKRVILNVPVDEARLSQAGAVGCAVSFTGRATTNAWLEVLDSSGHWLSSTDERTLLDTGNWGTVSLDLARACKTHARQVALFHDASGRAYIKAAVCLSAGNLKASAASLRVDCVGVGSTTWHYGFMSGTSMAAPAVSGLAAIAMARIPGYAQMEVSARAWKAANVLLAAARKSGALGGLCWTGGVATAKGLAAAAAADTQPYIGKITFEDAPDGSSTTFTIHGIGFGNTAGSAYVSAIAGTGATYTSWSDSKIVLRVPLVKGSHKVDVKVTNSSGKASDVVSTSALGGGEDPEDPPSPTPSDPKKPTGPTDPTVPTGPAEPSVSPDAPSDDKTGADVIPDTADALPPEPAIAACGVMGALLACAALVSRRRRTL